LVGPPCRTTMPGIERPANAREEQDRLGGTLARAGFGNPRASHEADRINGKDPNTAEGGNRVTKVR